jgi:putative hemolysin
LGFDRLEATYEKLRDRRQPIEEELLSHLNLHVVVSEKDLRAIPSTGAAVVIANHPTGIADGAVLASVLRRVRPDVKILGNELLASIPELRDLVIPIDVLSGKPRSAALRKALRFLKQGGLLIVFPAGEVSRFDWKSRTVRDGVWQEGVARLIELARPAIIPVHVGAANSALFHVAGTAHPLMRTALLVRELWNKQDATVTVRIGRQIDMQRLLSIASTVERSTYLRWRVDLLGRRQDFRPLTRLPLRRHKPFDQKIATPEQPEALAKEVNMLAPLCESGTLAVYISEAERIPTVLREIGRLREITFRAAGEGTGKSTDVDSFDQDYLHLFVWNRATHEVVGAYRLAPTDRVLNLYTKTLFGFDGKFLRALGPAIELGRSFIRQEYQRGFAPLLLLWKGIGKFVAAHPQYRVLFGPVSISNRYQTLSRDLMISFLERTASLPAWKDLVHPLHPVKGNDEASPCNDVDELSELVSEIEPDRAGIPVLLRQYLRLGGKLVGFNVDPEFSNTLDGLILVDLTRTEPKLLDRYLGKAEAALFLHHQKGQHATHQGIPH